MKTTATRSILLKKTPHQIINITTCRMTCGYIRAANELTDTNHHEAVYSRVDLASRRTWGRKCW